MSLDWPIPDEFILDNVLFKSCVGYLNFHTILFIYSFIFSKFAMFVCGFWLSFCVIYIFSPVLIRLHYSCDKPKFHAGMKSIFKYSLFFAWNYVITFCRRYVLVLSRMATLNKFIIFAFYRTYSNISQPAESSSRVDKLKLISY